MTEDTRIWFTRRVLRVDGSIQLLPDRVSIEDIHRLIGATLTDHVNLSFDREGLPDWVMVVDDLAYAKDLPVNVEATKLYHVRCEPHTMHQIRGDVVVVLDSDFGRPR